ncbi:MULTISPECIES: VCBS repeat-containing protein [unclassified Streptomyces]|uniref:FG-GAP repeat domain-containing protein n=1 Tax=unclassified Streptomyces TaxID=2593676 RepID=UPI0016558FE8|nr:VCBS repeat-containing protein [Streptomyces sp. CB02980]MCB8901314.1 VCBS repeat-containing protein [Streptomyces sp. CB02980]
MKTSTPRRAGLVLGSAAALVAGLCLAPAAQAAPDPGVSFGGATAVPLPAGSGKGTAPALGDLNGDGKADLVTPVRGSNTLVAALGDGKGGFAPGVSFTLDTGAYPTAVALADLNGDGRLDAVVAAALTRQPTQHGTESMGSIVELLGDGKGGFAPATSYFAPTLVNPSTNAMFPADIAVADMNGDAKPDVLTSNTNGDNVSVWTNDGTGALGTASNYYVGGGRPTSYSAAQLRPSGLRTGDVNGDGRTDVVTVNTGTSDISVLLGDGKGRLGPATRFADGVFLGRAIALGDVSGDGRPDAAVAHTDRTITVFLGDGAGAFGAPVTYPVGGSALAGVALTDVNTDGKPDLVTDNGPDNQPTVLLGDGTGTFRNAGPLYGTASGANGAYAVGDLNADGRPDLAAASTAPGVAAQVLLNTSKPKGTAQSMSVQVAKAPGVLSMEVNLPAVNFGTPAPGTVSTPAGLGTFTYTDTLSTTAPWSVTVATTDLVSGTDTIGWKNLRITAGGHLNGTGGQWTGIAKPGPGGHFPEGADPQPGTSLSPAVTMATGDGGTRGVFTHDGSTAQWNIPAETAPGSYSGTLQYTITG